MTKRIFRSIFLVALVVLLLSVALLSVVFYNDYAVQYRSELKSEALSMAHAINGGLAEEDYLRSLEQDKISPIRITWIGADGTVRYDNEAAPAQMENHAARTEVADALRYGAGESERYSATLSQKTFYYACRLQDGTVLRLAGTRDSVLGILLRMLRPAVAAVLVAIALAWLLSYRLSKRIVRPLNALDLEHPEQAEAYDELSRYFKFHDPFHETEDRLMQTLAYIDVKNFAHRIKGQVHMITGLDDDVCYPETQFAIYNRLEGPKEHLIMPEYAHEAMNVQVNDRVYNWLCGSKIPFRYVEK